MLQALHATPDRCLAASWRKAVADLLPQLISRRQDNEWLAAVPWKLPPQRCSWPCSCLPRLKTLGWPSRGRTTSYSPFLTTLLRPRPARQCALRPSCRHACVLPPPPRGHSCREPRDARKWLGFVATSHLPQHPVTTRVRSAQGNRRLAPLPARGWGGSSRLHTLYYFVKPGPSLALQDDGLPLMSPVGYR